ncbi:MAG: NAD+ kinase [Planctomycetota bacterium]|jgi:NAD+ kinase
MGAPDHGSVHRTLVVADMDKSVVREFTEELLPWLRSRIKHVELQPLLDFQSKFEELQSGEDPAPAFDLVIVLGGDGAMLTVVRAFGEQPVPTLGINFGRVGFLASTPVSHWRETVAGVLAGEGVIEGRMRISFEIESKRGPASGGVALNDVIVNRAAHQRMLTVSLTVGETWVTDYRADGLIVATPSGSTAYSLSAGGPILLPGVGAMLVTPICPQGLASRPIVLQPDADLTFELTYASGITTLVSDGQSYYPIEPGDRVHLRRHPVPYPLLTMPDLDPYRRLRDRLGWAQPLGNEPSRHGSLSK